MGFVCVVVAVRETVFVGINGSGLGCRPCVAWGGVSIVVPEQTFGGSASVLHLKVGGGGPGSRME